jgi:ABC-type transporter Mla subunit MlaD
MMNLSTDLDRRWSPALSQWPKPVMAQRESTSTAEDQSVEVNRVESQAASVGPAQHLNRQVHQVQQQLEQTVVVLNQLESVLSQLPTEPDGAPSNVGQQVESVQQAADQLQDGLQTSINHWLHQLSVLEITIRQPAEADQVSHRLQTQITSHWQQAVAVQVAHIPAIELSLTS